MRIFASLFAFALSVLPAMADPNDYSRIISFGDSLSDNGNLAHNVSPNPTQAPGYFGGRFSNGPTWIELLTGSPPSNDPNDSSMNRFWNGKAPFQPPYTVDGDVNAAIGGAQTVGGLVPSVQAQIGAFLLAGGRFGSNDLVSIQGGANDFFNFISNPTESPVDFAKETADNEARNIAFAISPSDFISIPNLPGAKTILVSNLPNLGATPGSNGNLVTAQGGLGLTVIYNTELDQKTRELAVEHPDVNLIQMDWFSALNVVIANPAAFGFTNVTDACFDKNTLTHCANPNEFLFWDNVHPTEAGHELLARYAALLLATEETGKAVGALGQVALTTRLEGSDIIFRRAINPFREGPGGLYAEVIGQTGSFDGSQSILGSTGFDFNTAGIRVGFDASEGPISFGSSIAYETGNINGRLLKSDLRSTQIDAYALTHLSAFFVGVEGGVSFNDYTGIERQTGMPTVTGDGGTESIDYSVAGTFGAQYRMAGITLTPAVKVGFASLNLDGYTESAPILALQYSDRDVTTGFWTARLRASTPLFGNSHAIAYGEVGYEDLFSTGDNYTAKLASNTAHAEKINDDLQASGLYFKAGVGGYLDNDIKLTGEYSVSLQNGNGDVQSGRLRVTIPLSSDAHISD